MAGERAAAKAADLEAYQREMRLRNLGEQNKQATEKQQRLALAQIKEDFERMQVVNNEMMRAVVKSSSLDHKLVSESLEEINRRAKRLKENLKMQDYQTTDAGEDKAANRRGRESIALDARRFYYELCQKPALSEHSGHRRQPSSQGRERSGEHHRAQPRREKDAGAR